MLRRQAFSTRKRAEGGQWDHLEENTVLGLCSDVPTGGKRGYTRNCREAKKTNSGLTFHRRAGAETVPGGMDFGSD
jgi:hypothetical protein